ncbi:thermonuclease family protein [Nostoc sp. DedQUE04]|uniref:thermonuclease family protein n=1 Tax=Nostoc sp. DedQUE04 TaxID=3075390 RepID=UPI002AD52C21|nr:thermonuclease family protein [Nostoc sp. DedQUE04]
MNSLQKTGIIFAAIALFSTTIWLITSEKNSSIALTEEWTFIDVTDAQTMTLRQTDGNQMQVWLCGIEASELGNEAREKLRSLVATNENQVMVIPVGKNEQGRTVAEVMVYGQGEAEISFQEELLKSGLARTQQGGVECPNQIAFENAQRLAKASKVGIWRQMK